MKSPLCLAALTGLLSISAAPAVAEKCDTARPSMTSYTAAPNYKEFIGEYNGHLRDDALCVSMFIERIDSDGNVQGQYSHGVYKPWGINSEKVWPFNGTIDKQTGEGEVHPGDRTITFSIDPNEGTMDFLFHGKTTKTPGELVRVGEP